MITIRHEKPEDVEGIRRVEEGAFGRTNEADLVDELRQNGRLVLSLVAVAKDQIIGHVAFSPVTIGGLLQETKALGLGPIAVFPERQGRGIGSALVKRGLADCRQAAYQCVFVLGDPPYYAKFGFQPAIRFGLRSEYKGSESVFMVVGLVEGGLSGFKGMVKYAPEFKGD